MGGAGPILHLGIGGSISLIFVVSTRLACGDSIASSNRSQEDEMESNRKPSPVPGELTGPHRKAARRLLSGEREAARPEQTVERKHGPVLGRETLVVLVSWSHCRNPL